MNHEKIKTTIAGLLSNLGFTEADIEVSHEEGMDTLWFSITSPATRLLLTRDAEALGALNHLAMRMVEKASADGEKYPRVVIDANGFEKKKIDNLKTVAHMMAERARYFKASVDLEPMSAHDRKVIHEFISTMSDLATESAGEGAGRHIVIKYVGGI